MTPERYRGLRGLVRHVVRDQKPGDIRYPLSGGAVRGRQAVGAFQGKAPRGICKWCGLAIQEGRARMWHGSCVDWYSIARGQRTGKNGRLLFRDPARRCIQPDDPDCRHWNCPMACQACGAQVTEHAAYRGLELDHIMAIGVAARLGFRFYVRAFTPDNLWWICRECHKVKTAYDRAFMQSLDNAWKTPKMPKTPPNQGILAI